MARVKSPRRVLVISHSHPELTKGGAEIAAYNHYLKLAEQPDHQAWFLGCSRDLVGQHTGAIISQPFGPNEYVYGCSGFDWFNFSNMDPRFPEAFRSLLQDIQPDEVHFHHYLNVGLEAILHVKETLPKARVTVTLHEYLAICHHYGQMVTKPQLTLCYGSAPRKCATCFPEKAPEDFFLRKRYIDRFFDLVDEFVSPSEFLAGRYREWGIDAARITVRENIVFSPSGPPVPPRRRRPDTSPLRVAYFGQISKLKGIGVLLDAAELLHARKDYRVVFAIHGDDSGQPEEFRKEFRDRIQDAGPNVMRCGPYAAEQVLDLMAAVDAVVVPSIWWENSPLVIQEALAVGVPVFASDLGGMKEKVTGTRGGQVFPAGNAPELVSMLLELLKPA